MEKRICSNCGAPLEDDYAFCAVCGKPVPAPKPIEAEPEPAIAIEQKIIKETAVCKNCGAPMHSTDPACPECGMRNPDFRDNAEQTVQQPVSSYQPELVAQPASPYQPQPAVQTVPTYPTEPAVQPVSSPNAAPQKAAQPQIVRKQMMDSSVSHTKMWSELKQSSSRKLFYTENKPGISEEEYFRKLQEKLNENQVPAYLDTRRFEWDNAGVYRTQTIVVPNVTTANPNSCLLQVSHVGYFTFVEHKTFITPPNLPPYPENMKSVDSDGVRNSIIMGGIGVLLVVFGLKMLILLVFGLVLIFLAYLAYKSCKEAQAHNSKVRQQRQAWNKAWDEWKKLSFVGAFEEDSNGEIGRIYEAVFETMNQVNKEVFHAEPASVENDTANLNELEDLIARRKKEYQ